ncbi:ATP-dependent DNA helicase pcrA [Coxiella-like endosymbiont]|uniref:UvrD-helicase domain-containing protein n=2 Tax=Coxiellaceae TaxID=118968 RepID=UPI000CC7D1D7|nr:UvrD-helicase domain-containing protein [Coxiella-like endosymbiont]PMB54301.1 ATP-dependent DNA helicase pcrA [Coxiella-like endosymbiont]
MSDPEAIRRKALNPIQSYIVQAPAGSGKTELLIQRFLKLLSISSTPEEIVAITFTRKSAIEMRERILQALNEAKNLLKPKDDYKALTWILAKKVLERDKIFQWQLEINPHRLRILTIDALVHQICSQMPILTGFGAPPEIKEDNEIEVCYQRAIKQLLISDDYKRILEPLLLHLDNKADLLEKLLIKMLSHREQWIEHIIDYYSNPDLLKKKLEKGLEFIALDAMQKASNLIDNTLANQLIHLIPFTSINVQKTKSTNIISAYASPHTELLKIKIQNLSVWKGIANLLLTQKGEWRKRIDKSVGFPPNSGYKQEKLQMQNLLAQ